MSSSSKGESKKVQSESIKGLGKLNQALKELSYFSSELQRNLDKSGNLLMSDSDLELQIRSGLENM